MGSVDILIGPVGQYYFLSSFDETQINFVAISTEYRYWYRYVSENMASEVVAVGCNRLPALWPTDCFVCFCI